MPDLTKSHHKAVAGLGPDLQRVLLGEARMQRWSVRQLKAARERINAPRPARHSPAAHSQCRQRTRSIWPGFFLVARRWWRTGASARR